MRMENYAIFNANWKLMMCFVVRYKPNMSLTTYFWQTTAVIFIYRWQLSRQYVVDIISCRDSCNLSKMTNLVNFFSAKFESGRKNCARFIIDYIYCYRKFTKTHPVYKKCYTCTSNTALWQTSDGCLLQLSFS